MSSFQAAIHNEQMPFRLDPAHRVVPVLLGFLALASTLVLFAWDGDPRLFPARAHDGIEAFSLAMIAIAYLVYQIVRRTRGVELAKSILLAAAFFFWAANQIVRSPRAATLCNDVAIALFVLDVFLVMAGVPSTADASFAEAHIAEEKR
jgi:hypothetical protein